jgi:aquaporin NIP
MDVSLSIPSAPAASMLVDRENMSDDKISIFIPQRSPSNKILPLRFQQNEASDDPPPLSAKSMTLALIKKVMTSANPELITKSLVTN